ncbi:MAG: DJ-1/PfpI family protein [Candidatus Babeliales bacterium]
MVTKKALFVIASTDYQPIEYTIPKNLLEQAGFTVVTASNALGIAHATDHSTTPVDILVHDAVVTDYDGIFFVGGAGALEYLDNHASYALITKAIQAKKVVGAICISTRILAHSGILKDKQATGFNGDNELGAIYQEHRIHYIPKDVVVDGRIITATGPNAAREYAEVVITLLQED